MSHQKLLLFADELRCKGGTFVKFLEDITENYFDCIWNNIDVYAVL